MNCKIRRWQMNDAKGMAAILSNKKITDNLRDGIPYPYTQENAKEYLDSILSADMNRDFSFAVIYDDKLAGSIRIYRQENVHYRTAELGYYLDEKLWGKGIMTCAVKQAVEYVFDNTDIVRIFSDVYDYNTASCRVLEKCGFECEGVLRCGAVKNGRMVDLKIYSIINEDK